MNDFNYYLKKYGEYAEVTEIKYPIIKAVGLPSAKIKEIVIVESGEMGQIFDLGKDSVRILLFSPLAIKVGTKISRTDSQLKIPARQDYFGHILDPFCNPLTGQLSNKKTDSFLSVDIDPLNI